MGSVGVYTVTNHMRHVRTLPNQTIFDTCRGPPLFSSLNVKNFRTSCPLSQNILTFSVTGCRFGTLHDTLRILPAPCRPNTHWILPTLCLPVTVPWTESQLQWGGGGVSQHSFLSKWYVRSWTVIAEGARFFSLHVMYRYRYCLSNFVCPVPSVLSWWYHSIPSCRVCLVLRPTY